MPNDLFRAEFVQTADVSDLERVQRELAQLQFNLDPRGGQRTAMQLALGMLHRYATDIVDIDTGRLKNSLFWDMPGAAGNRLFGILATNVSYSIYVERRGGDHAFMERTMREEGPNAVELFGIHTLGLTR